MPEVRKAIDNTDALTRAVHGGASAAARNFDALAARRTPARQAGYQVSLFAAHR